MHAHASALAPGNARAITPATASEIDDVLAELTGAPEVKAHTGPAQAPATKAGGLDTQIARITDAVVEQGRAIEAIASRIETPRADPAIEPKMRATHAFRALNDSIERKRQVGRADPLAEHQLERISAYISDTERKERETLLARNRQLEAENKRLATKAARPVTAARTLPGLPARDQKAVDLAIYRKAVMHHLRTGETHFEGKSVSDLQRKALRVGSNPDGGYVVVPEADRDPIAATLLEISPMRQMATVRSISAASLTMAIDKRGTAAGWVGEENSRPQTTTPELAQLEFKAFELYAMPAATQSILDDAMIDVEEWLASGVRDAFAKQEGAAFVTGTGINQPQGYLTPEKVANASWAWGKVGYIATGSSGAFPGSDPTDKLIDLAYALKAGHRANASWAMARPTVGVLRKFKDTTGQYLVQPSVQAGQPSNLLGYPLYEDEEVPVIAANSFSVALGDWRKAYVIVDRTGVRVIRDPYSSKPYVLFYTTRRVGGGVQDFEAYKLLKFGTS